jgi:hypothetical protein
MCRLNSREATWVNNLMQVIGVALYCTTLFEELFFTLTGFPATPESGSLTYRQKVSRLVWASTLAAIKCTLQCSIEPWSSPKNGPERQYSAAAWGTLQNPVGHMSELTWSSMPCKAWSCCVAKITMSRKGVSVWLVPQYRIQPPGISAYSALCRVILPRQGLGA